MQIKRQKYSYELLQECSNYLNTHSLKETAIHYNLSYKTMINGLIRFGFYTPTRKHKITKNNCYNQNFFSKIDSHDKAYFLGFLMADGYICTTPYNKQIGIGIQTKDKYICNDIVSAGHKDDELSVARNLYAILRDFDKQKVEYVYSESFETKNVGQAVMNRLIKAAGHKIVKLD